MSNEDGTDKPTDSNANHTVVPDFVTAIISKVIGGVVSGPENEGWYRHVRRMWIGASGGLFYAIVTNLANDRIGIVGLLTMEPGGKKSELVIGYLSAAIVSVSTGATAAWLSAQNGARMLFLIGIMGMTIIKSIFFPNLHVSMLAPFAITSAFAQSSTSDCVGDTAYEKGFKAFFGVKQTYNKFAVVVASGKTPADAQAKFSALRNEDQSLKLKVGPRACDNDFYPVLASDYLALDDAKSLLEKAKKVAPDAYLSPGPK